MAGEAFMSPTVIKPWAEKLIRDWHLDSIANRTDWVTLVERDDPGSGRKVPAVEERFPPNHEIDDCLTWTHAQLRKLADLDFEKGHPVRTPTQSEFAKMSEPLVRCSQELFLFDPLPERTSELTNPTTHLNLPIEDQWLTVSQAASVSGLSKSLISKAATAGDLVSRGHGRQRRISPASLTKFQLLRDASSRIEETVKQVEAKFKRSEQK
jgi:hypothetical protein